MAVSLKAREIKDDISVTQDVNLDTIESDVALNNAHRVIVAGNPHSVTAVEIPVTDAGAHYSASDVEAAFIELGPLNNGSQIDTHDHVKLIEVGSPISAGQGIRVYDDVGQKVSPLSVEQDPITDNVVAHTTTLLGANNAICQIPTTNKVVMMCAGYYPTRNASMTVSVADYDDITHTYSNITTAPFELNAVQQSVGLGTMALAYDPIRDEIILCWDDAFNESYVTLVAGTVNANNTITWKPTSKTVILSEYSYGPSYFSYNAVDDSFLIFHGLYFFVPPPEAQFMGFTYDGVDFTVAGAVELLPTRYTNSSNDESPSPTIYLGGNRMVQTHYDQYNVGSEVLYITLLSQSSGVPTILDEWTGDWFEGNNYEYFCRIVWTGDYLIGVWINPVTQLMTTQAFTVTGDVITPVGNRVDFASDIDAHYSFARSASLEWHVDTNAAYVLGRAETNENNLKGVKITIDAEGQVAVIDLGLIYAAGARLSAMNAHSIGGDIHLILDRGRTTMRFFAFSPILPLSYTAEYVGIAQESGSEGQTKMMALDGQISRVHSDLEPGARYYVQTDNSISTVESDFPIGKALSATEMLIDVDENAHALTEEVHFTQTDIDIPSNQIGDTVLNTNGATDAGKIAELNSLGQLHPSVIPSSPMSIWNTTTKTAAYTAVAGDEILADTATTGAFIVTMPLTPTPGDKVRVVDSKGNFFTANLTIARNGENIKGVADDLDLDLDGAFIEFTFVDATFGWSYILYV